MIPSRSLYGALAVLALVPRVAVAEGPSIGQFELKDLEAGPGHLQFQSQNAYSWGQPRRETAVAGGDLVADENSVTRMRAALEMEMGLTDYLKGRIGIEYEKELLDDPGSLSEANTFGDLTLNEIGGELIAILHRREGDGWGLGFVTEAEHPLDGGANRINMGPILELQSGPWFGAFLPMLVHHFGGDHPPGEQRDEKWDFMYAAQTLYAASHNWSFGVEAYGTIDRLGSSGHGNDAAELFGDHDQHRLGPIVYYTYDLPGLSLKQQLAAREGRTDEEAEGPNVRIGIGYFMGLNDNTPDGTGKLSIEVNF